MILKMDVEYCQSDNIKITDNAKACYMKYGMIDGVPVTGEWK